MQEELESGQPLQGGLVARWQLPVYWQFDRYLTALDTGLPELDFMLRQTRSRMATSFFKAGFVANRCGGLTGRLCCSRRFPESGTKKFPDLGIRSIAQTD
jgi:hypothetical protein